MLNSLGPNERRCVTRQSLDYYRSLVIGGVYSLTIRSDVDVVHDAFRKALKHAIRRHPILSATIAGEHGESPIFTRPSKLDLSNHINILDPQELTTRAHDTTDETDLIKLAVKHANDQTFESCAYVPPWRVVLLPLSNHHEDERCRYLVLFANFHSHGDGKSCLAFHRTLLEGLELALGESCPYTSTAECEPSTSPLVPNMEQVGNFKVSWSYLLSPFLGIYLPKVVSKFFNLRPSHIPEVDDLWRGLETCHDPNNFSTGVEILRIENEMIQKVLMSCRARGAKLTGLLHQLIVRALSEAIPATTAGSFVSQTAVDLRSQLQGITDDDMAVCPTGYLELFSRNDSQYWDNWTTADDKHPVWAAARKTTDGLAECSGSLYDQPVTLLQYLSKFRPWMMGQIGKARECSYELSNIMVFNPHAKVATSRCDIESMVFSQPANATSSCLSFNVVSRKGGDMVMVLSWQLGVLGIADEQKFTAAVCRSIGTSIRELANA